MSEMVERVARAMVRNAWGIDEDQELEAVTVNGADLDFMELARAAIEAMREPTDAMIRASMAYSREGDGDDLVRLDYQAMIDEALK